MISFFRLLTELSSQKWLSSLTGMFAKSSFSKIFISRFAKTYQIAVEEAEKSLHEYKSLNDFFTRRLKKGTRTIDPSPNSIISPVDAVITGIGPIEKGMMLNIKGQDYTIAELLQNETRTNQFADGYYFVLYLSPRDYHRIHVPIDGTITEKKHLSGKVYPVNEFGLRHMKRVLSRNERLITYIQEKTTNDTFEVAVVKVGALNVSSIQYVDTLSNQVIRGDELAYFEFGSTIVLLIDKEVLPDSSLALGTTVRMGQSIAKIRNQRNL